MTASLSGIQRPSSCPVFLFAVQYDPILHPTLPRTFPPCNVIFGKSNKRHLLHRLTVDTESQWSNCGACGASLHLLSSMFCMCAIANTAPITGWCRGQAVCVGTKPDYSLYMLCSPATNSWHDFLLHVCCCQLQRMLGKDFLKHRTI